MNAIWQNFLHARHRIFDNECALNGDKRLYALTHLAVLTVSGQDAATLLQGQITCDVREITDDNSSLCALCNPKGQVISTFLLLKNRDDFLLILPKDLLAVVQARLQRVVLRSKVTITDSSAQYCLIGINDAQSQAKVAGRCTRHDDALNVNFFQRQLVIATTETAMRLWSGYLADDSLQPDSLTHWQYADILAGMPWLTSETSEQFIPQQLGLDKLGGISFNKGCYTGQEIVARTHYLGKVKRGLFVAKCNINQLLELGTIIHNATDQQPIGKVFAAQIKDEYCYVQLVLQRTDDEIYKLQLAEPYTNVAIELI